MSMSKETERVGKLDYEPKKLNMLTEPGAKQHAFKKLRNYQKSKGWVFSEKDKEFNTVSDEEDLAREIYFGLNLKMIAIFASDKRGVIHSVEELLTLVETDLDSFNSLYLLAIEQNPSLKDKSEETEPDPN